MGKNNYQRNDDLRKTLKYNPDKRKKTKNNSGLLNIIALIAIIVAISIAVVNNINNGKKISQEDVKEYNYFITTINGKSGVIDKTGKIIINPEYDYIQIPNPSKPIFIALFDYNKDTQEYNSKVLNEKGKEILTSYKNVQAIPNNNTSSTNSYLTSILKYKQDDKYGIITIDGKTVTKPVYESIEVLEYKDEVLKVKQNDKFGLININGDVIIKPEYNSIATDSYYNQSSKYQKAGYIVNVVTEQGYRYGYINSQGKQVLDTMFTNVKRITEVKDDNNTYLITYKNGQAGILKNGQTVIENEYEDISYDVTNNILVLQKNAKQGVYDLAGNMILPIQYDNIEILGTLINATKDGKLMVFNVSGTVQDENSLKAMYPENNYYITVDRNGKYGVADQNKNSIINNEYNYIEYAFDKYFIATKNEKIGVIDETGNIVIPIENSIVQNINGTKIIQIINSETNVSDIYNSKMEKVLSQSDSRIYLKENYIKLVSADDIKYIDYDGNLKDAQEIFTNNTVFAKKENGKWGYVDRSGNTVVDYKYEFATNINEYGYGAVKQNGKWGVVNAQGQLIKEAVYTLDDIEPYFIGEYYQVSNIYEIPYYSNEVK